MYRLIQARPGANDHLGGAGRPKDRIEALVISEHLTPRSSFNAWQETVRTISQSWDPAHVEAAKYFAQVYQKQLLPGQPRVKPITNAR